MEIFIGIIATFSIIAGIMLLCVGLITFWRQEVKEKNKAQMEEVAKKIIEASTK